MSISRIFRVLITLIFVVSFIVVVVSVYKRNRNFERMTELTDGASTVTTRLASEKLALQDGGESSNPYLISPEKLSHLNPNMVLAGDNYHFQVAVVYLRESSRIEVGPHGRNPPEDEMVCSLSLSVGVREDGIIHPGKLKVKAWRD